MDMHSAKFPVIIALQGDPYTGKTTLANRLAKFLKLLVIRIDDILDVISPNGSTPTPDSSADTIMSQAFDLAIEIVKAQTSLGLHIIIDSPLSRLSHLNKLVRLLTDSQDQEEASSVSIVIIDCKPPIGYSWQVLTDGPDSSCRYKDKWYKLDPEFGRDYTDNDIHPLVSKLVIDTTDLFPLSHLGAAVLHLATSAKGYKVDFKEWVCGQYADTRLYPHQCPEKDIIINDVSTKEFCQDGHCITVYKEDGIGYACTCGVCNDQVTNLGGAYTCYHCPLAIHKSCAELTAGAHGSNPTTFTRETFPRFLHTDVPNAASYYYCFPQEHLCARCREEGKEFSYECQSCIFETHFKCRLLPTILHHRAHVHRLSFTARSISNRGPWVCSACRRSIEYVAYRCNMGYCNVTYHPECVFLPPFVRQHRHGGHVHDLDMRFRREEELDEFACDLCFDNMNPQAWSYHCKDCLLWLHLDCAFKDFDAS